jgi:hypothetical protein
MRRVSQGGNDRPVRVNRKRQVFAIAMTVGLANGFCLHAAAAASGELGALGEVAYVAATSVGTLFDLSEGMAALILLGLTLVCVALPGERAAALERSS